MSDAMQMLAGTSCVAQTPKGKSCLLKVIRHHFEACGVDTNQPVLVLGGGQEDLEMLAA